MLHHPEDPACLGPSALTAPFRRLCPQRRSLPSLPLAPAKCHPNREAFAGRPVYSNLPSPMLTSCTLHLLILLCFPTVLITTRQQYVFAHCQSPPTRMNKWGMSLCTLPLLEARTVPSTKKARIVKE